MIQTFDTHPFPLPPGAAHAALNAPPENSNVAHTVIMERSTFGLLLVALADADGHTLATDSWR